MRLRIVPVDLKTANDFVRMLHRHSRPVVSHRFSVGVADDEGALRRIAIVGRQVATHLDNGGSSGDAQHFAAELIGRFDTFEAANNRAAQFEFGGQG